MCVLLLTFLKVACLTELLPKHPLPVFGPRVMEYLEMGHQLKLKVKTSKKTTQLFKILKNNAS